MLIVHSSSDPQTNEWDLMDSDMLQRLSARKWISMGLERELRLDPIPCSAFLQSDRATSTNFHEELIMGPIKFRLVFDYFNSQGQGLEDEAVKDAATVFEAGTPGVMTFRELAEEVDLGQWKLLIGGRVVRMNVCLEIDICGLMSHRNLADILIRISWVGRKAIYLTLDLSREELQS